MTKEEKKIKDHETYMKNHEKNLAYAKDYYAWHGVGSYKKGYNAYMREYMKEYRSKKKNANK
jgi:hypothetical protein